jgi:hypothetical protein
VVLKKIKENAVACRGHRETLLFSRRRLVEPHTS